MERSNQPLCLWYFIRHVLIITRPVNTFSHACVYYHKFRLLVKDTEYQYETAAIAALFLACKAEDTLKKSKEIICAAHNMKVATIDALSPDDPVSIHPLAYWLY